MVVGHAETGPGWWLLRVDTGGMSSEDEVLRLRGEGLSIRAIAERLGLSKSRVGRIVAAAELADDEDEDDDGGGLFGLFDPEPQLVEPFTFCGVEVEIVQHPGCDPEPAEQERWLDGNGRRARSWTSTAIGLTGRAITATTRPASGSPPTWHASAPSGSDGPAWVLTPDTN